MVNVKRIDRIAIAVRNLDEAAETFEKLFGLRVIHREVVPKDGYHYAAFAAGEGECVLECLSPYNDPEGQGPIARFIKNRGEGVYMVGMRVENLDEAEEGLRAEGIKPIWHRTEFRNPPGDEYPMSIESYVHPNATHGVLIGLHQPVPGSEA